MGEWKSRYNNALGIYCAEGTAMLVGMVACLGEEPYRHESTVPQEKQRGNMSALATVNDEA